MTSDAVREHYECKTDRQSASLNYIKATHIVTPVVATTDVTTCMVHAIETPLPAVFD